MHFSPIEFSDTYYRQKPYLIFKGQSGMFAVHDIEFNGEWEFKTGVSTLKKTQSFLIQV